MRKKPKKKLNIIGTTNMLIQRYSLMKGTTTQFMIKFRRRVSFENSLK